MTKQKNVRVADCVSVGVIGEPVHRRYVEIRERTAMLCAWDYPLGVDRF